MHLIALLIGLVIERLATQLFHLRRLRWIDRIIDAGFRQANRVPNWPALIPIVIIAILLMLPVLIVVLVLGDALFGFLYLLLSVIVLFFSLGPQDIGEDVDEYCNAIEEGDSERVHETAKAIIENDVPEDTLQRIHRVEEAICVQSNNRLFAVIFWFILLPVGPLGAWTYRVTDLVRRRAVVAAERDDVENGNSERLRDAAALLHGWLAWIPARLTAIGYAAAGNFDSAIGAWRAPSELEADSPTEYNEHLLARVGFAALALTDDPDEDLVSRGIRGARAAKRLVFRLLMIWAVVIAAMTLYGWTQ